MKQMLLFSQQNHFFVLKWHYFRVFKFYELFRCMVETFANYSIDQFYDTDQIQTQSNFFAKYDVAIKCNFAGLRLEA